MMKHEIRITELAIADVVEIVEHIAEDSPVSAAEVGRAIYSKIESLADFPKMGPSLSSKIGIMTDYRFLTSGAYLIFYKIEGNYVSIYRVLNGARDYLTVLFNEQLPTD